MFNKIRSSRFILASALGLALATLAAGQSYADDHRVDIQSMKFSVPALEVTVGDTITFTNHDAAPHTATANDDLFDTGRLNNGQSATVTITAAGTIDYFCVVHPSMKASLTAKISRAGAGFIPVPPLVFIPLQPMIWWRSACCLSARACARLRERSSRARHAGGAARLYGRVPARSHRRQFAVFFACLVMSVAALAMEWHADQSER